MNRTDLLASLQQDPSLDVLVIGGGINGVGVLRDLALNGVKTLLVERSDFCGGASAASSHMAHGGIRYLENGEFRLVREAVHERNRLIENAPHLVRPLPTTIPIFRLFSGILNAPLKFLNLLNRPSERGALIIKMGLMMYDAYTRAQKTVPPHIFLNRAESLARWSMLNPDVRYTATYYDGSIFSPERLTVELLLDAEADGGRALNYVSAVGASGNRVKLQDELTGETFDVTPRLVINAAGPWIDPVNRAISIATRLIGGTKGSHVVLNHPELRAAIGENEFFFENKDGRIVLIFPLADKVLIGTSDLPIQNADDAVCTDEEVDYFIEMIRRVFPSLRVTRDHIVFRFSGVRPLPAANARTAGQISRDHSIQVLSGHGTGVDFPIYSLVGGKWTTYRAFAEQVTDKSLAFLQLQRQKSTDLLPIGGGKAYPHGEAEAKKWLDGLRAWTNLPAAHLQTLFERYGARADQLALYLTKGNDAPLQSLPEYSRREIEWLALNEKIVHLDDLILRRSMLAMLGLLSRPALEELANTLAAPLGWDEAKVQEELTRTQAILSARHGVRL
jgi:glycerol-3-phosphate dehydrogenase